MRVIVNSPLGSLELNDENSMSTNKRFFIALLGVFAAGIIFNVQSGHRTR